MTSFTRAGAMLAAAMLIVQPCAASEFREAQSVQRQSAAFAGLNVRLPLGQAQKAKPTARLQLTTFHTFRDERTGAMHSFRAQGLEIGGKGGKPNLYLNGQSTADMQKKLNVGGTGTTLLIVGGVLLVLVVVAVAASGPGLGECEPYEGNDDHCID